MNKAPSKNAKSQSGKKDMILTSSMRCVMIMVLFSLGLAAMDLKPLAGPDAPLVKTRLESTYAQWVELIVTSYAKNGAHGVWDADMTKLLTHIARIRGGQPSDLSQSDAQALAKSLSAPSSCSDPLAAWSAWYLASGKTPRWDAAWKALKEFDADAVKRHDAVRHPRMLEAMVAAELLASYGRSPKEPHRQRALDLAQRLAGALAASIRRQECAIFPPVLIFEMRNIELKHQDFGEPVRIAIDEAVAEAKTEPWVGCAMRGVIRISNAWAWRSGGWAKDVTEEGWAGFGKNLKEADELLTESWRANPNDPLAAAYGCTLAGAGNSATPFETWYLRSTKACFDHGIAFEAAMNFLQPRWGGSYDQMLALGCDSLDTGRFDTIVPWRVILAAKEAILDAEKMKQVDDLRQALNKPRVVKAISDCLDGCLKLYPEQRSYISCVRAAMHWHAGREKQARAALADVLDADLDGSIERDFHVDLKAIKHPPVHIAPEF